MSVGRAVLVRRSVACAAAALVAIVVGACDRRFDCENFYRGVSAGPLSSTSATWVDALRSRSLRVRVHAPLPVAEARPLVVFSSGLGAVEADQEELGRYLAAHGYTFVVVVHPESSSAVTCGTATGAACWSKLEATEPDPNVWMHRIDDMQFAITNMLATPASAGNVDATRIAVGGHSFGAFTALTLVGTTFVDPRNQTRVDATDERVRAAFVMSPQGSRWFGLDEQSWAAITRPTLFMTGDQDGTSLPSASPAWRREPFERVKPGNKWLLRLTDASHMSFTSQVRENHLSTLQQRVILAFLDAYVRGDVNARSSLDGDRVRACSKGRAALVSK